MQVYTKNVLGGDIDILYTCSKFQSEMKSLKTF